MRSLIIILRIFTSRINWSNFHWNIFLILLYCICMRVWVCVMRSIYSYDEILLNKITLDFGIVISIATEPFFTFRTSQTNSKTQTFTISHSQFTVLYINGMEWRWFKLTAYTECYGVWYVSLARNSYMGNGWVGFKAGILKNFHMINVCFCFNWLQNVACREWHKSKVNAFSVLFSSIIWNWIERRKIIVSKVVYSIMHWVFESGERYSQKYFLQMPRQTVDSNNNQRYIVTTSR